MKIQDPVYTIMSKRLITLHPKDKIEAAKKIFDEHEIHHIPIVVMNKIVGIISLGDILFLSKKPIMHSFDRFIRDQKLSIDAVEEIMIKDVRSIKQSTTIEEAIQAMLNNRINALPVHDGNKELVGLVTSYDIMKKLIQR